MNVDVNIALNQKTFRKLNVMPSKFVYSVARQTLERSYPTIPLSKNVNNGRLRTSSMAYGVKGSGTTYTIGSQTSYAKYVWNMNNSTTNWSTPGTSSEWYTNFFKKNGKSIMANAMQESRLV